MNKKLKYVLPVNDNVHDNFFHEREIKKINPENVLLQKVQKRKQCLARMIGSFFRNMLKVDFDLFYNAGRSIEISCLRL
jgi:hypothetical protein